MGLHIYEWIDNTKFNRYSALFFIIFIVIVCIGMFNMNNKLICVSVYFTLQYCHSVHPCKLCFVSVNVHNKMVKYN